MKFFLPVLLLVAAVTLTNQALAQETTSATDATSSTPRTTIKDKINLRATALQEKQASKVAEIKARVAEKQAEVKERREERRELLVSKLKKVKDQRKATVVQRVDGNLVKINEQKTAQLSQHLEKMSEMLRKIESRLNQAAANGKNVSEAQVAIASASAAITKAEELVVAQSSKSYTISISSESALKSNVVTTRDSLHQDLQAVHQLVVEARHTLALALSSVAKLGGTGSGE